MLPIFLFWPPGHGMKWALLPDCWFQKDKHFAWSTPTPFYCAGEVIKYNMKYIVCVPASEPARGKERMQGQREEEKKQGKT